MTIRQYTTARTFKQALEHRLKTSSTSDADFARRRQLLVLKRFLARLAQVPRLLHRHRRRRILRGSPTASTRSGGKTPNSRHPITA